MAIWKITFSTQLCFNDFGGKKKVSKGTNGWLAGNKVVSVSPLMLFEFPFHIIRPADILSSTTSSRVQYCFGVELKRTLEEKAFSPSTQLSWAVFKHYGSLTCEVALLAC